METIEEIKEARRELLKEETKCWLENCEPCTLISEAIKRGELTPGTDCSRSNPVCDACPIHKKMLDFGDKLLDLTLKERYLRG
ncbi:hypothetical protein F373_gp170 [Bacillus phage SP-10]|uniref:hypothetical protein n=1 Tax=Bacillus phage SP10 TaxID=941058 RepID=UPI0002198B7E|nr:hypothetical protein F373_gp170 [Bacillus phage SP-10]BAK52982.1 hypothetical protein [Bacillus phage SP-10]